MLKEFLKISRPGLWFPTIWIYILPLGNDLSATNDPLFWIGLFFVCFPLNFFVYGLNDLGDVNADKFNNRKGNFLFGAKADEPTLRKAVKWATIFLFAFMILFTLTSGWQMIPLFLAIALFNYVYNFKPYRIKTRPPFELAIQVGYILTAVFSSYLNDLDQIPWQTMIYLCFFCFQAHLAGEIMDLDPDREAGKKTTANLFGRVNAKLFMFLLLLIEVFILIFWFNDLVLAAGLGAFAIWLLIDVFLVFRNKSYTLSEMMLFGYGMNIIGLASMVWLLLEAKLLHPIWP